MTPEPGVTGKAKLDRDGLEKQGVFIFDGDPIQGDSIPTLNKDGGYNRTLLRARAHFRQTDPGWDTEEVCGSIPNHVCWLRELMLDHAGLVPSFSLDGLKANERAEIPTAAIYEDENHFSRSRPEKKMTEQVASKACYNIENHVYEDEWQYFMNAYIFQRYREGRPSLLDGRTNVLWSEPKARRQPFDPAHVMSDPKPDMFFGFPIERPSQRAARGFERSALVYNFTLARLHALTVEGLYSSPTRGLASYGLNRPFTRNRSLSVPDNDLVCFPFAVVELKHSSIGPREEMFCFCQAANAASFALGMLENLYSLADKHSTNAHVPAAVAFTCIGPQVRVWIAYSVCAPGGRPRHFMIPIWQSPMTSVWAVLEMQSVLRNLMRYATRVLRPNISTQLSRWRHSVSSASKVDNMFEDSATVAQDRRPFSKVMEERGYWNGKLYGTKRSSTARDDDPRKRVASLILAALDSM